MWKWLLFNAVLFIAFVPGVLVTLPPKGDKMTVLLVHMILFAIAHKLLGCYVKRLEFFDMPDTRVDSLGCPAGSVRDSKGECRLP